VVHAGQIRHCRHPEIQGFLESGVRGIAGGDADAADAPNAAGADCPSAAATDVYQEIRDQQVTHPVRDQQVTHPVCDPQVTHPVCDPQVTHPVNAHPKK
jgi:hypothetical protein